MMQFTFLRFLGNALLSYEQLNESPSSVNISTDTVVETTIEENYDDLFHSCDSFSVRHQQQKIALKKTTQYKDTTIRKKVT